LIFWRRLTSRGHKKRRRRKSKVGCNAPDGYTTAHTNSVPTLEAPIIAPGGLGNPLMITYGGAMGAVPQMPQGLGVPNGAIPGGVYMMNNGGF
jgi:hypothetical protein